METAPPNPSCNEADPAGPAADGDAKRLGSHRVGLADWRHWLARPLGNVAMRREAGWVLGHKLIEFLLVFAGLKLYTNLMTREAFGEFNLALTGVGLLSDALVMPIAHAFYRSLSHRGADDVGCSYGGSFLRWYTGVTLSIAALVCLLTRPLSFWLHIGPWTAFATGLLFLANRWRALGVELLDMRRDRRGSTLNNLGFIALQTGAVAAAAYVWPVVTAAALIAYALAGAVFAWTGTRRCLRSVLSHGSLPSRTLWPMIATFGVPYGALLVCQWVQNFAERYILAIQLDLDAVGTYVAAYQVCGIPYMLFAAVFNGLAVPIAYERAGDASDARRLAEADRILMISVGAYLVLGILVIPLYVFWGGTAMRLLTSQGFVLPQGILICLTLGRFTQCLGFVVQPFFAVHQRMGASLLFRTIGGLLVVPICWFAVRQFGLMGAGIGVLVSGAVYTLLMFAGPGGCIALVRSTRRRLDSDALLDGNGPERSLRNS